MSWPTDTRLLLVILLVLVIFGAAYVIISHFDGLDDTDV